LRISRPASMPPLVADFLSIEPIYCSP
jgi:hypothetical protein